MSLCFWLSFVLRSAAPTFTAKVCDISCHYLRVDYIGLSFACLRLPSSSSHIANSCLSTTNPLCIHSCLEFSSPTLITRLATKSQNATVRSTFSAFISLPFRSFHFLCSNVPRISGLLEFRCYTHFSFAVTSAQDSTLGSGVFSTATTRHSKVHIPSPTAKSLINGL